MIVKCLLNLVVGEWCEFRKYSILSDNSKNGENWEK